MSDADQSCALRAIVAAQMSTIAREAKEVSMRPGEEPRLERKDLEGTPPLLA